MCYKSRKPYPLQRCGLLDYISSSTALCARNVHIRHHLELGELRLVPSLRHGPKMVEPYKCGLGFVMMATCPHNIRPVYNNQRSNSEICLDALPTTTDYASTKSLNKHV